MRLSASAPAYIGRGQYFYSPIRAPEKPTTVSESLSIEEDPCSLADRIVEPPSPQPSLFLSERPYHTLAGFALDIIHGRTQIRAEEIDSILRPMEETMKKIHDRLTPIITFGNVPPLFTLCLNSTLIPDGDDAPKSVKEMLAKYDHQIEVIIDDINSCAAMHAEKHSIVYVEYLQLILLIQICSLFSEHINFDIDLLGKRFINTPLLEDTAHTLTKMLGVSLPCAPHKMTDLISALHALKPHGHLTNPQAKILAIPDTPYRLVLFGEEHVSNYETLLQTPISKDELAKCRDEKDIVTLLKERMDGVEQQFLSFALAHIVDGDSKGLLRVFAKNKELFSKLLACTKSLKETLTIKLEERAIDHYHKAVLAILNAAPDRTIEVAEGAYASLTNNNRIIPSGIDAFKWIFKRCGEKLFPSDFPDLHDKTCAHLRHGKKEKEALDCIRYFWVRKVTIENVIGWIPSNPDAAVPRIFNMLALNLANKIMAKHQESGVNELFTYLKDKVKPIYEQDVIPYNTKLDRAACLMGKNRSSISPKRKIQNSVSFS